MIAKNTLFGLDKYIGGPLIRVADTDTGEAFILPRSVVSGMIMFGGNFELKTQEI
jgi:hypothetical protein